MTHVESKGQPQGKVVPGVGQRQIYEKKAKMLQGLTISWEMWQARNDTAIPIKTNENS